MCCRPLFLQTVVYYKYNNMPLLLISVNPLSIFNVVVVVVVVERHLSNFL